MFGVTFSKLLLFILHFTFGIFEFTCDVWVYLKYQIVKFRVHNESSEFSSRIKSLTKIPRHLTILLGQEKLSYEDLARLVVWSAASGISFLSFYDYTGILKKTEADLQYEVEKLKHKSDHVLWHHEHRNNIKNGFTGKIVHVKVYCPEDGRRCIANVCKHLSTTEESSNVDLKLIDGCLQKHYDFPEPELAICCGEVFCLYGYPPWQISVTEFLHIKSHHNMRTIRFVELLERYSKCHQRLGK